MSKRSRKDQQYVDLEARIARGDLGALFGRWEFGKKMLVERGAHKQLKSGRLDELCNALRRSRRELQNRMQFAYQYMTETKVRDAFKQYGSWYAICQKGLGARSAGAWRGETETNAVHRAIALLSGAARSFLEPNSPEDRQMATIINDRGILDQEGDLWLDRLYDVMLMLRRRVDCGLEALGKKLVGGGAYWSSGGGLLALIGTEKDLAERRTRTRAVLRREAARM